MIKFKVQYDLNLTPAQQLERYELRKALRIACNRAARGIKTAVVAAAERVRRYGFLAKSIRIKVKVYPSDKTVTIVGPTRSYKRTKGKYKEGPRKGQKKVIIPGAYAHLVEKGTKRSRAKPWLKPAAATAIPQFEQEVGREIKREIDAFLARRGAK